MGPCCDVHAPQPGLAPCEADPLGDLQYPADTLLEKEYVRARARARTHLLHCEYWHTADT